MKAAWTILACMMLLVLILVVGLKAAACPPVPPPPPPPPNCGEQTPWCICNDEGRCWWVWTCSNRSVNYHPDPFCKVWGAPALCGMKDLFEVKR